MFYFGFNIVIKTVFAQIVNVDRSEISSRQRYFRLVLASA